MSKKQLIIELEGEKEFYCRTGSLTIHSGEEGEGLPGLWVRPGEKIEIVMLSPLGKGADLWLFPRRHTLAALEPEDFVHQDESGQGRQRVELEAQTTTVRVNRSPLGPSESREYYVEACKRGAPMPIPPDVEGNAGSLNTSPG